MPRIESVRRGGAYPLEPEWRKYLWRLFKPFEASKGKRAIVLDPFANEGDTLLEVADHLNLDPYAVEVQQKYVEAGRVKMAKFYQEHGQVDYSLTRFIYGDSYHMQMSNGSAAIVIANPPYDDQIIGNSDQHTVEASTFGNYGSFRKERYELTCINQFFKYVAPGGFFVWIGYSSHMSKKVFQAFNQNCDNLIVFRFPEEHLDHYTQVCIVANYIKGYEKTTDPAKLKEKEDWFVDLGKNPEKILDISKVYEVLEKKDAYLFPGTVSGVQFPAIPPLNIYRGAVWFTPQQVDVEARKKLNELYGAQHTSGFREAIKATKDRPLERPLHPTNKRKMAENIASGMLDNIELVRNGRKALLRGSVRELYQKVAEEKERVNNKEESFTRVYTTTMIRPDHHIMLLYSDGEVEDISGMDALAAIIQENSQLLIDNFQKRYKPFYDMQIDPVWRKVLGSLMPLGKFNFFIAQKRVICCTIENMAINGKQITNAQQGFGKTSISAATMICLRILHLALNNEPDAELPKIAKRFGVTKKEFDALVPNLCARYGVKPEDMKGIAPDAPVVVSVPPIAPSVWMTQELPPMYDGFEMRQLFTPSDADAFMAEATVNEDAETIYVGVISYENAKANEGREPAAVPHYDRYFSWMNDENGVPKRNVIVHKKPSDPITGEIILDRKGEPVPWARFTREKRGKTLESYVGKVFYGYKTKMVQLPDGKKELQLDKTSSGRLYSHIVTRKLTKADEEANKNAGYPQIMSRQYPLYSEIRTFGAPKIGNGRVETPMIQKEFPPRMITQVRFTANGYKCKPYLEEVRVGGYSLLVPDYDNQKNLTGEPIVDPWISNMGIRYLDRGGGRKDAIDKLMSAKKLTHYRMGTGHKDLDALLSKQGIFQYEVGSGKVQPHNPRYPLANYFRRAHLGKIALFIPDELHLVKNNVTEIAASFRDLAQASIAVLGLTGTLYGGKSSSVYALAYAFDENIRRDYPWQRGAPMKWVEDMGVRKMVETRDIGGGNAALRQGRAQAPRITEAPGASPLLGRTIAPYTLWANLADLGDEMPKKEEVSYEVEFGAEEAEVYKGIMEEVRRYNAERIQQFDKSFLAEYYQTGLCIGDAFHRPWTVMHRMTLDKGVARKKYAGVLPIIVCEIPSLGPELKAKEKQALEFLAKDLADGRRVIISLCQTESRDIRDRWLDIISQYVDKAKPFILKSTVKSNKRSDYIQKQVKEGYNVMITNGGLITTAISINNFSAWYSIEYSASLYTFSQATARINRPSQESDDIVYRHFYWNDKFQKRAIMNIADKTKAAAVLAGAESGDLAAMMSSEERVMSYESILKAIEDGQDKLKSADEIKSAFKVQSVNWKDSAWYMPGDENEVHGEVYVEDGLEVEEEPEDDGEPVSEPAGT